MCLIELKKKNPGLKKKYYNLEFVVTVYVVFFKYYSIKTGSKVLDKME